MYAMLALTVVSCAAGAYATSTMMAGLASLSHFASLALTLFLAFSGDRKALPTVGRVGALLALGFFLGASIAPYLSFLVYTGDAE